MYIPIPPFASFVGHFLLLGVHSRFMLFSFQFSSEHALNYLSLDTNITARLKYYDDPHSDLSVFTICLFSDPGVYGVNSVYSILSHSSGILPVYTFRYHLYASCRC